MARYNFFISYSARDGEEYARLITQLLIQKGYTVWTFSELRIGDDWAQVIADTISNCDCFLPIITDTYNSGEIPRRELFMAIKCSNDRATRIIPILFTEGLLPDLSLLIGKYHSIRVRSIEDIAFAVDRIDREYGYALKSSVLYERLTEYKGIGNEEKINYTLCHIINLALQKWAITPRQIIESLYREIYRLYRELEGYCGGQDDGSRELAKLIMTTMDKTVDMLIMDYNNLLVSDSIRRVIYLSSFAIRLLYSDRIIRRRCQEILNGGDVIIIYSNEWYISKQAAFVKSYNDLIEQVSASAGFSDEDIAFIKGTSEFIIDDSTPDNPVISSGITSDECVLTEEDDILLSIAKFMHEGNKLFDILQSRGMAGDFLGCLLTSYERLKNYCEVVGAKTVAADCVDRIVEIRNAIKYSDNDGSSDEKIENGIKSLLGLTIRGSGNYDVFISFKSEDSDLAERIYDLCQRHLKVPFWSKRTLPQLSKSEYEDAIYDAIRKSKHFVVVLSKLEYMEANWIRREMAAFNRAITEGRKKNANFVFVVTDDVYKAIIDSNKMCLDERYCGYQIIKMSEFEETLMSYIV